MKLTVIVKDFLSYEENVLCSTAEFIVKGLIQSQ
jgi:hypothetical protein